MVNNPSLFPEQHDILTCTEPVAEARIIAPKEYLSPLLRLCLVRYTFSSIYYLLFIFYIFYVYYILFIYFYIALHCIVLFYFIYHLFMCGVFQRTRGRSRTSWRWSCCSRSCSRPMARCRPPPSLRWNASCTTPSPSSPSPRCRAAADPPAIANTCTSPPRNAHAT